MKIIKQSHKILHLDGIDRIELAARTCYKSEEKIGCQLANPENNDCFAKEPLCGFCNLSTAAKMTKHLVKLGHHAMLEHGSATVRFVTDRGVTHEIVRQRLASFGQESTRYVNYNGRDMQFILPVWLEDVDEYDPGMILWESSMAGSEMDYKRLLAIGWAPEEARDVLPTSLATTIVVTANYREWRHILSLRALGTAGRPHPQMRALMLPLLKEFKNRVPAVFEDMGEE